MFAVDLFNEGLDIPEVDTVLFLRPTESATVFLQQLGRGLRLIRGKTVLTALDFVGHQRREFRFDQRFRAMTGVGGKALQRQVEEGFPFLPSGSQIILDRVAQTLVLENIRQQVAPRWAALVSEVRAHPDDRLASYLDASGRALEDILRNNRSWTTLCREAGKIDRPTGCSRTRPGQASTGSCTCRRPTQMGDIQVDARRTDRYVQPSRTADGRNAVLLAVPERWRIRRYRNGSRAPSKRICGRRDETSR